jgi:hypothetical protein
MLGGSVGQNPTDRRPENDTGQRCQALAKLLARVRDCAFINWFGVVEHALVVALSHELRCDGDSIHGARRLHSACAAGCP